MENIDLRDAFFDRLYEIANRDRNVILITADMGAFSLEKYKRDLPSQYINAGVAEQNMISVAAGLALGGKKVFAYAIIPFVTLRCFEQIKVDLCCMNLPVTLVGVGIGVTYGSDGPTHHAIHDIGVMRNLPEITILNPSDAVVTSSCADMAYNSKGPVYVRVDKGIEPILYSDGGHDFSSGLKKVKEGSELLIVSSGIMVHKAIEVAHALDRKGVSSGVLDLFRVKPLNCGLLLDYLKEIKCVVTIEDNTITCGIGSEICEFLLDNSRFIPIKRIAFADIHCFDKGDRDLIHKSHGLDSKSVIEKIMSWLKDKKLIKS